MNGEKIYIYIFFKSVKHLFSHVKISKEWSTDFLLDQYNSHLSIAARDYCKGKRNDRSVFPNPTSVTSCSFLRRVSAGVCQSSILFLDQKQPGTEADHLRFTRESNISLSLEATLTNMKAGSLSIGIFPYKRDVFFRWVIPIVFRIIWIRS